jgi:hypothetical protein
MRAGEKLMNEGHYGCPDVRVGVLGAFDRLVGLDVEATGKHANNRFEPLIET